MKSKDSRESVGIMNPTFNPERRISLNEKKKSIKEEANKRIISKEEEEEELL